MASRRRRKFRLGHDPIDRTSVLELILTEGRKRQVRRMLAAVSHPAITLMRTKIGRIPIGRLRPGQWRHLTKGEVQSLLAESV